MYKVLIIDDEKIIRIALKSMINWEQEGFSICGTASNCSSALEILKEQSPHLLIVDIMMPETDGITFVKQIRSSGFKGEIIILSNHQKFDYAIEALHNNVFDYILKTDISPELLISILKKVKLTLDKRDFQQPTTPNSVALKDDLEFLYPLIKEGDLHDHQQRLSTPYLFLEIFLRSKLLSSNKSSSVPEGTLNSLISEISECSSFPILQLSENSTLVLIPKEEQVQFLSSLNTVTTQIENLVKLYMNTQCGFICSEPFKSTTEFLQKLNKLPFLEQLILYHGFGKVIHETDSNRYTCDSIHLSSFILDIKKLIANENYKECKQLLHDQMNFFKNSSFKPDILRKSLANIYSFLIFDNSNCLEKSKERIQEIALRYRKCCTLEEYFFLLNELIDLISSNRLSSVISSFRNEIQMIDIFIEENIDKKISLSMLAQYVNRSESYLSRLFKTETGINIIHYINTKKMQHAKELLINPDISISEIAHSLGFEESSYFNKIFNKIYGINPSDYRKTIVTTLKMLDI